MSVDWFARPQKNILSPFELCGEGRGHALVLRYAGCNLKCPLCYAWKYAWYPKDNGHQYKVEDCLSALASLHSLVKKKIVWVRIQGGEPCLNYERILNTVDCAMKALRVIELYGLSYYPITRVVIQTNGIPFYRLSDTQLDNVVKRIADSLSGVGPGRIVFEVSFKSANNEDMLDKQIAAFDVLLNRIMIPLWQSGHSNVAIYPIAGLGPSIDSDNDWLIPIDAASLPQEVPLFHRTTWSRAFEELISHFTRDVVTSYETYLSFRQNPLSASGSKVAIEELEAPRFQTSWISGYADRYAQYCVDMPAIHEILRRKSGAMNVQWKALCIQGKGRYNERWLSVLEQIPVAGNPGQLLSDIVSMRSYFYPSHPVGHYPYL